MPNVLNVAFHRRPALPRLVKATVKQKFSNHTLALLDYEVTNHRDYLLPPENTLVQVRWGTSPLGVSVTYGYVNHYETVADDQDKPKTRMVVLGTSKVMNTMSTLSWQQQTRSSMVRDLAARHRLRSVVHDHPHVAENWATGTRTDFQALKALSEETGYHLWVDGPTLWFLDPDRWLRDASSMTVPVISRRSLNNIKVLGGANIPGETGRSTRRVQYGLDYRTNELFAATSGSTANPTEVVGETATTFADAFQNAESMDRKQGDYYSLRATFAGDARIHPGSIVAFESGKVNRDQGGQWLVHETSHEITRDSFLSTVSASRRVDKIPSPRLISTARGSSALVPAVVRDGSTWEAQLQEHIHA